MAIYAIGDVQGCYGDLQALLKEIRFHADCDQLWFAGDLVNRGPHSLEVLRFVRGLGEQAVTVLGNHDLHLLAIAHIGMKPKRSDTLQDILEAPDRDELLHWLRMRPLLHHDPQIGYTLLHAGLPPQWDLTQAQAHAREVEAMLMGADYKACLAQMYGDKPDQWSDDLAGWERMRFIVNCFTRLRYCDIDGHLALGFKGIPGSQPAKLFPWYEVPTRQHADLKIVFGHWSTLQHCDVPGIYHIDTGCVWGGTLTALRLDADTMRYQVPCVGARKPGSG